jgi:hypothetical protein
MGKCKEIKTGSQTGILSKYCPVKTSIFVQPKRTILGQGYELQVQFHDRRIYSHIDVGEDI